MPVAKVEIGVTNARVITTNHNNCTASWFNRCSKRKPGRGEPGVFLQPGIYLLGMPEVNGR